MVEIMRKENRKLKVCEQSGYRYKPTPTLMLKGAWLEEWGFTTNMPVSVQCEEGRLIITPMETADFIDTFEQQQLPCKVAEGKGVY